MTKINFFSEQWLHIDADEDHGIDEGEVIVNRNNNLRYTVSGVITKISTEEKEPAADIGISKENGRFESFYAAGSAASGCNSILYETFDEKGAYWTFRKLSRPLDSRTLATHQSLYSFFSTAIGPQNTTRINKESILYQKGSIQTDRESIVGLNLISPHNGRRFTAFWRRDDASGQLIADETLTQNMKEESQAAPEHLTLIGETPGDLYYSGPFSEKMSSREKWAGTIIHAAQSVYDDINPTDYEVYLSESHGRFETAKEAMDFCFQAGTGTAVIYRVDGDTQFTVRSVLLKADEEGAIPLHPRSLSSGMMQNIEAMLGTNAFFSHENDNEVNYFDPKLAETDPRLLEIQAAVDDAHYQVFDRLYNQTGNRTPDEMYAYREHLVSTLLDPKERIPIKFRIEDQLARTEGRIENRLAPTGRPNGLRVYFMNAMNIAKAAHPLFQFGNYNGDNTAEAVNSLRERGFEVVFIDGASAADHLVALYDPDTAGLIWNGHSGPGIISGDRGFYLDYAGDVDSRLVSRNLSVIRVLGCNFTESEAVRTVLGTDVVISGYDRLAHVLVDGIIDKQIEVPRATDNVIGTSQAVIAARHYAKEHGWTREEGNFDLKEIFVTSNGQRLQFSPTGEAGSFDVRNIENNTNYRFQYPKDDHLTMSYTFLETKQGLLYIREEGKDFVIYNSAGEMIGKTPHGSYAPEGRLNFFTNEPPYQYQVKIYEHDLPQYLGYEILESVTDNKGQTHLVFYNNTDSTTGSNLYYAVVKTEDLKNGTARIDLDRQQTSLEIDLGYTGKGIASFSNDRQTLVVLHAYPNQGHFSISVFKQGKKVMTENYSADFLEVASLRDKETQWAQGFLVSAENDGTIKITYKGLRVQHTLTQNVSQKGVKS